MPRKSKTTSVQWLHIPAFPIPIYAGKVLLCVTRDEWASVAATYDSDPDTEGCKGLAIRHLNEEGRTYVVGVFDKAVDTLIHELDHTTFHILGDVGIPLEDGGANEPHTYLLGWLTREVLPVFLAKTKR
jgi:hypothetical protein